MDRLWAPWRLAYVSGEEGGGSKNRAQSGCIFCDKPAANEDAANCILLRGGSCFVLLNAYPYNNGHLMVVPYRHIDRPDLLTADEGAELMALAARMTTALSAVYRPDGYNIGMNVGSAAGAGIAAHLHLHVVPRWSGDTNFMPVIGDVKVMPESLEQVYVKLTRALAADAVAQEGSEEQR